MTFPEIVVRLSGFSSLRTLSAQKSGSSQNTGHHTGQECIDSQSTTNSFRTIQPPKFGGNTRAVGFTGAGIRHLFFGEELWIYGWDGLHGQRWPALCLVDSHCSLLFLFFTLVMRTTFHFICQATLFLAIFEACFVGMEQSRVTSTSNYGPVDNPGTEFIRSILSAFLAFALTYDAYSGQITPGRGLKVTTLHKLIA